MEQSFKREIRSSLVKVLFTSVFFVFVTALVFEAISFQSHKNLAQNFATLTREQILLGDFRTPLQDAGSLLRSESRFTQIKFDDFRGQNVFEVHERTIQTFDLTLTIRVPIFYDQKDTTLAGTWIFRYSIQKAIITVSVLMLLGLITAFFVFQTLRKNLIEKYNKTLEFHRQDAVIQAAQHLAHDMRASLGTFERILVTDDSELPQMRAAVKSSLSRIYAMVDSLRFAETEDIIKPRVAEISFAQGYLDLLPRAEARKIRLSIPEGRFTNLWLDVPKFDRAWMNLVSNAIEFASSLVKVELEISDANLTLRVLDDGPGVSEEFFPKLFLRGATHGREDGSGLGLAYVKRVMMGHGGDVRYYRDAQFSVFECVLPNITPMKQVEADQEKMNQESIAVRKVGVVLEPSSLQRAVFSQLVLLRDEGITWHEGFDSGFQFLITNQDSIADLCLDEGISVAQFPIETKAAEIIRRSMIRLGIKLVERTFDA